MIHAERELTADRGNINEQTTILEEYNGIIEELKNELHLRKAEQTNLRSQLEVLRNENQNVEDIKDALRQIHLEECGNHDIYQKEVSNLEERIALLQTEKESVLQLWHISLNTIDVLEEELKASRVDGKSTKFYQEQANTIKETYSEAIKALEGKLLQAKENFLRQQALCQTNKERIESLSRERDDVVHKFTYLERESQEKDRTNQLKIETLQKELSYARAEIDKLIQQKLEIERKLNDTKRFAENVIEKDKETKLKMAEAIDLVESAVKEKDMALHREGLVLEEKARLEFRIATIASEYDAKIEELNRKMKDENDRNIKHYTSEITELKLQLNEKMIVLNRTQKELKIIEEELEKTRRNSEDTVQNLHVKIRDYEKKLQHVEHEDVKVRSKYDMEITQLTQKIAILEEKLNNSNEKLKRLEQQNSTTMQDKVKIVDERSKSMMEQYATLENQLAKTLGNKEDLLLQLKLLKQDFEHEMQKRDSDRHCLENKLHELEMNLQKTSYRKENKVEDVLIEQPHPCSKDTKNTFDITVQNKCHCCQTVLSDQITRLQEKFERKNKELIHHVQVHQKLSKRWRDEAKSLTTRFQGKTKELRSKISALQKENNELNKELNICKQQAAQFRTEDIQKYNIVR